MSIDFRNVVLHPLCGFTASAPASAIIGVIGENNSGIHELLQIAAEVVRPTSGEVRTQAKSGTVVTMDQPLATQDAITRFKTIAELYRLRHSGSTILLTSHEIPLLELLCDEVWWLDAGKLALKGNPKFVLAAYMHHVASKIREWGETIPPRLAPSLNEGDGRAQIVSIETFGSDGKPTVVWKSGEMVRVRAVVRFLEAIAQPVLGMMIHTQIGSEVYGTNTELEGIELGPRREGDVIAVAFSFRCDLCPYAYRITMASHDPDGIAHHWLDDAVEIHVVDDRYTAGVANLRAKVTVEPLTCLRA